jgi:PRTRC genetic system ThiF family protein
MTYRIVPKGVGGGWTLYVVGCGGTGSLISDGLCRLLIGIDVPIVLIDYDRVEPHNLRRQNFYPPDLGKYKSQVLAERLSRQYGRPIRYSIYPYDASLLGDKMGHMWVKQGNALVIGCVDTPEARRSIARDFTYGQWWIDSGNGNSSGQVLIGNARRKQELEGAFNEPDEEVSALPIPSMQLPSLLAPVTVPEKPRDCAEAVAANEQSAVINQAMAMLVLQFIEKFLYKKLTWMGAYIDMDAGTLHTVPAEPVIVARMLGVKVDTLMANRCSIGDRYSLKKGG